MLVQQYWKSVRAALEIGLCIREMPSALFEDDNKPYVEVAGYNEVFSQLVMRPIYIARNSREVCLVEPSINSCRISFKIRTNDEIEGKIIEKLAKMVEYRVQKLDIFRKKPLKGFDITFLITTATLAKYSRNRIINMIVDLLENIERGVSEIKLNINESSKFAANYFQRMLNDSTPVPLP